MVSRFAEITKHVFPFLKYGVGCGIPFRINHKNMFLLEIRHRAWYPVSQKPPTQSVFRNMESRVVSHFAEITKTTDVYLYKYVQYVLYNIICI